MKEQLEAILCVQGFLLHKRLSPCPITSPLKLSCRCRMNTNATGDISYRGTGHQVKNLETLTCRITCEWLSNPRHDTHDKYTLIHWIAFYFLRKNFKELQSSMAPHSSTLAWKVPWTEEPGRLQSMGLLRVGNDWATSLSLFTFKHWRRKWQPTPVFLPGESQGRGSLVGCHLWGLTESDTTEAT